MRCAQTALVGGEERIQRNVAGLCLPNATLANAHPYGPRMKRSAPPPHSVRQRGPSSRWPGQRKARLVLARRAFINVPMSWSGLAVVARYRSRLTIGGGVVHRADSAGRCRLLTAREVGCSGIGRVRLRTRAGRCSAISRLRGAGVVHGAHGPGRGGLLPTGKVLARLVDV